MSNTQQLNKKRIEVISLVTLFISIVFLSTSCNRNTSTYDIEKAEFNLSEKDLADSTSQTTYTSYLNPEAPYDYHHPLLKEADSLDKINEHLEALTAYQKASENLKKNRDWEGYAWALIRICTYYQNARELKNDWEKAIPYIEDLFINIFNKPEFRNYHPFVASALGCKAVQHMNSFEVDSAKRCLEIALKIRENYFKRPSSYISNIYFYLSRIAFDLEANIPLADEYQEIGKDILSKSEDAHPSLKNYFIIESYSTSMERHHLLKNYEKSTSFAYKILDSLHILQPEIASYFELMAYNVIGDNLKNKGQLWLASSILDTARQKFMQSNVYDSTEYYYLYNLLKTSETFAELNKEEDGIKILKKIINTADNLKSPDIHITEIEGDAHTCLGNILINQKEYDLARTSLLKAKSIYDSLSLDLFTKQSAIYELLGDTYRIEDQNLELALNYYDKSISTLINEDLLDVNGLPKINSWWDHPFLMRILKKKGHILLEQSVNSSHPLKSLELAKLYFQKAIDFSNETFYYLERENDQYEFTKSIRSIYESALNCLFLIDSISKNNNVSLMALDIIEGSKAKSLSKQINEIRRLDDSGVNADLIQQDLDLKREYSYLQVKIKSLKNEIPQNEEVVSKYYSRILEIENQRESLRNQMNSQGNSLFPALYFNDSEEPFSHNTIELVYDNVISYFWGEKYCFIVSKSVKNHSFHKVHIDAKDTTEVLSVVDQLSHGYQLESEQEDFETFCKASYHIYQKFVAPTNIISAQNDPIELLVIRDGPLSLIPFETLITDLWTKSYISYNELEYLIKKVIISYGISLRTIQKNKNDSNLYFQKPKVLAFNYDTTTISNDLLDPSKRRSGLILLPGSTLEIASISKLFPTTLVPKSLPNKDYFLTQASSFDILLLSIHGALDSIYESKLIFFGTDSSESEILYPFEIMGIPLQSKIVILAACESGIGEYIPGEGMLSMARTFFEAGANSVIMSLWQVPDISTAKVMIPFYEHLSSGLKIDESLTKAKITYISNSDHRMAHPGNWGGMIMMGTNQAIVNPISWKVSISVALLIILMLLIVTYRYFTKNLKYKNRLDP